MEVTFSFIFQEIKKTWRASKGKVISNPNLLSLIYDAVIEPASEKTANDVSWYVGALERHASQVALGQIDVKEEIQKLLKPGEIEEGFELCLIENLINEFDVNEFEILVHTILDSIKNSSNVEENQKQDFEAIAKVSHSEFLAKVLLFFMRQNNKKSAVRRGRGDQKSANNESLSQHDARVKKHSDNSREHSTRKNDISQTIYEKSCENYSQLTKDYTPNEMLFPHLSAEVTGCCQIIGDGGSGKSTFLIKRFKELKDAYGIDSVNNPLAIYIPLNQYKGIAVHGETFIKNYIATTYANVAPQEFDWNPRNYYVMLDGANESPYASQLGKEIQDLVTLGCTILITSRYKLNWKSLKSFTCVTLNELDDEVIKKSLTEKGLPIAEGRLLQTLRRPMWLALYLGIKNVEGVNTPGEILREHHNHLLSKVADDIQGEQYTKNYKVALGNIHRLATITKTIVFNESDIPLENGSFLHDKASRDEFLSICTATGLLKEIGLDSYNGSMLYQWSHEHYWDYYRAFNVFSVMEGGIIPPDLEASKLPNTVLIFLGELYGEYHYTTKESVEEAKSPLEQWMQRHLKRRKNTASVVRNLVDCMKQARNNHIVAQYNGLDLSLTNFYGCWISNSSFKQAIVSETTFVAKGHSTDPDCVSILPERGLIASSSISERQVYIWEYVSGQFLFSVECPKTIAAIDFSPDGRYLAVMLRDEEVTVLIYSLNHPSDDPIKLHAYDASPYDDEEGYEEEDSPIGQRMVFFNMESDKIFGIWEWGHLMSWDIPTGKKHFESPICTIPEMGEHYHISLSPSRNSILCAVEKEYFRYTVSMYDLVSGETEELATNLSDPCCVGYTPDDRYVVYSYGNDISVVENPYCGYEVGNASTFHMQDMAVTQELVFKYNGQWDAEQQRFSRQIDIIRLSDLCIIGTMDADMGQSGMCYDPISDCLLQAYNSCISFFDPNSQNITLTLQGHGNRGTKYLIDFITETEIVRIFADGRADLFDCPTMQFKRLNRLSKILPQKQDVSFCALSKRMYFTVKNEKLLEVWDVLAEKHIQAFEGDFANVSSIELAYDGEWVVIKQKDHTTIYLGNIVTGELRTWNITSKYDDRVSICKRPDGQFWYSTTQSKGAWQENIRDYPKDYSRIDSITEDLSCPTEWLVLRSVYHIDSTLLKVVIGTYDGQIIVLDILSDKVLLAREIHHAPIEAITFVPGTDLIVSIARNGEAISHDWKKGTTNCYWSEEISKYNTDLCVIPVAQNRVIVKSDFMGKAALINPANGETVAELPGHSVYGYVVSEDGSTIAVEDMSFLDSTFEIIEQHKAYCSSTGKCKLDKRFISTHSWTQMCLSPRGNTMAIVSSKGYVVGWNTKNEDQVCGWDFTDVEDLYCANFEGTIGLTQLLSALLKMNGGIV